jgi:hypothetical protein
MINWIQLISGVKKMFSAYAGFVQRTANPCCRVKRSSWSTMPATVMRLFRRVATGGAAVSRSASARHIDGMLMHSSILGQ